MLKRYLLFATVMAVLLVSSTLPAQQSQESDLDALMSRVLATRDDNWKKLQQYLLEEQETFQLTGTSAVPLYGMRRDYTWFLRDGIFVRSPVRVDGVAVSERDRQRAEATWIALQQKQAARTPKAPIDAPAGGGSDAIFHTLQPQFVSMAYFLRFTFEPGHYALVGRERLLDRDVLRIEYYPDKLYRDDDDCTMRVGGDNATLSCTAQDGPDERRRRPADPRAQADAVRIGRKMNKVALVTLWIEPTEHQILQYQFDNVGFDFLPGRSIARLDDLHASMRMGQPFPGVWLPASMEVRFGITLATGPLNARYETRYHDFRLATVTTRIIR